MKGWLRLWSVCLLACLALPAYGQKTVQYFHTDALGSVVAVTGANGALIERREYEPYGAQLTPAVQDGPGYTGHVQDAETGLVYMQQRYYDPNIGVMLSVDPVTAYQQPITNFCRYCYARNNPYKFTDPDGRDGRRAANFATALILSDENYEAWRAAEAASPGGSAAVGAGDSGRGLRDGFSALRDGAGLAAAAAVTGTRIGSRRGAGRNNSGPKTDGAGGAAGGERAGKPFTRAGKDQVRTENASRHNGQTTCSDCGQATVPAQQSRAGVTPPRNETHVDHIIPQSRDGNGSPDNGQVLCRECNLRKGSN